MSSLSELQSNAYDQKGFSQYLLNLVKENLTLASFQFTNC